MFEYSAKHITILLNGIFDGTITEMDLPEALYMAIAQHLTKGLYKGFGASIADVAKSVRTGAGLFDTTDLELLAELRSNVYMFSAAKAYWQVKIMRESLTTDNGTVRPFKDFKKDAKKTFDTYNVDYLKTEYNTAIGQGQNAIKWNNIVKQSDLFPMLKYDAIIDKNTSDICRPLDGLTAPVGDPVWRSIMPLNHFNCRCLVRQLTAGEASETVLSRKNIMFNEATGKMDDIFKMNPGQDGYVFKEDHPYFTVPKADKGLAKDNFNLPIPKNDK